MLRSIIPNCQNSHNLQNTTHQFLVVLFFLLYFYQSTIYYKSDIVMDDGYEAKYFNVQIGVLAEYQVTWANLVCSSYMWVNAAKIDKQAENENRCIIASTAKIAIILLRTCLHGKHHYAEVMQSFRKIVGFCEENTHPETFIISILYML